MLYEFDRTINTRGPTSVAVKSIVCVFFIQYPHSPVAGASGVLPG